MGFLHAIPTVQCEGRLTELKRVVGGSEEERGQVTGSAGTLGAQRVQPILHKTNTQYKSYNINESYILF